MEQYNSRVSIPSEIAALASPEMVRMDGGQEFQVAGESLLNLGIRLHQVKEARQVAQGIAEYNSMVDEYVNSLGDKDPNDFDYVKNFDKLNIQKVYKGKSRSAVDKLKNQFMVWNQSNQANLAKMSIDKSIALAKIETADVMENAIQNLQPESAEMWFNDLRSAGIFTETEIKHFEKNFEQLYQEHVHEIQLDNVLNQAVNAGSKEKGLEVLDKSGLSVDDKLKLDDKVIDWYSRQDKNIQENQRQKTIATYKDFIPLILTNQLDKTMIESSNLSKNGDDNDQERWSGYIDNAYTKEPPKQSLAQGFDTLRQVILDFSKGLKSDKTAYDDLLDARYKDMTISNADFNWAVQKISKPYPKYMANQIDEFLIQIPKAEKKMDAMLEIEDNISDPKKLQDVITRYTTEAKEEKAKEIVKSYEKKVSRYDPLVAMDIGGMSMPKQPKKIEAIKYPTVEDYIEHKPESETEFEDIIKRYGILIKNAKTETKKQYYKELSKEYYDKWLNQW